MGRGHSCQCTGGEWVLTALIYHLSAQVLPTDGAEQDPPQAGTKPGTNPALSSSGLSCEHCAREEPPKQGLGAHPGQLPAVSKEGACLETLEIKVGRKLLK